MTTMAPHEPNTIQSLFDAQKNSNQPPYSALRAHNYLYSAPTIPQNQLRPTNTPQKTNYVAQYACEVFAHFLTIYCFMW